MKIVVGGGSGRVGSKAAGRLAAEGHEVLAASLRSAVDAVTANPGEAVSIRDGCGHIRAVSSVKHPRRHECDECVKMGAKWVHLRTCQTCGGARCCDSSPNQHASRHAAASGHPVVCSAEPGERWLYCYPDGEAVEY